MKIELDDDMEFDEEIENLISSSNVKISKSDKKKEEPKKFKKDGWNEDR